MCGGGGGRLHVTKHPDAECLRRRFTSFFLSVFCSVLVPARLSCKLPRTLSEGYNSGPFRWLPRYVLLSLDIRVAHVCVLVCWVEFKCWLPWWICRDPVCFALLVVLNRTIVVKLSIYLSFFHIDSIFGLWSSILLHWCVI